MVIIGTVVLDEGDILFNILEEQLYFYGYNKYIFHICNIVGNIHLGDHIAFRLDVVKDIFCTSTAETNSGFF